MSNDSTAVPSSPLEGPPLDTDAAATRRSGTEALDPAALEEIAVDVAVAAAGLVRRRLRRYYR